MDTERPAESNAEPAVSIDGVRHAYGSTRALDGVRFEVPSGALFGLLGPNGSGKTTLFRIITTLLAPDEGRVRVFGADTAGASHRVRQEIGMVFQHTALDEDLTVRENWQMHGSLFGLDRGEIETRSKPLFDQLGIADRADDRVSALSGGLRRRADLGRGLLHRPRLLLLDEPTSGLDPIARRDLWERLQELQTLGETTILLATHLMEEAERCDRVAIINEGRLARTGRPSRLKKEVGRETLWLESPDAPGLRDRIEAQFGFDARVFGEAVQVIHEEAHSVLGAVYEAHGDRITSATVREPTLEDVFMIATGHPIDERRADAAPAR